MGPFLVIALLGLAVLVQWRRGRKKSAEKVVAAQLYISTNYSSTYLLTTYYLLLTTHLLTYLLLTAHLLTAYCSPTYCLQAVSAQLYILFLVYPSCTQRSFMVFKCITLDDETRWLRADMSLSCDDPVHRVMMVYAVLVAICFTVGTPLLYAYFFFVRYRRLLATHLLLLTHYRSLLTTHCLLLTTYCILRTTYGILLTAYHLLLTTYYLLLTAYYLHYAPHTPISSFPAAG